MNCSKPSLIPQTILTEAIEINLRRAQELKVMTTSLDCAIKSWAHLSDKSSEASLFHATGMRSRVAPQQLPGATIHQLTG
jgi:hypothetical protein